MSFFSSFSDASWCTHTGMRVEQDPDDPAPATLADRTLSGTGATERPRSIQFGGCSATRARRRRRRAQFDALRELGGSGSSCSTAMRPLLSSEPPVWSRFRTISHTVVRPPRVRKTPDGPETRPDGWFRRTQGGGRPSQVLFGPAGPNVAVIHQRTEAPHTTPNSRECAGRDARRRISNKYLRNRYLHIACGEGSAIISKSKS